MNVVAKLGDTVLLVEEGLDPTSPLTMGVMYRPGSRRAQEVRVQSALIMGDWHEVKGQKMDLPFDVNVRSFGRAVADG